jgi:membrane protein YqaA with SNARE-associated domain
MRTLSRSLVAMCASPGGVVVLAALDSTMFFSLPFGIDAAVVLLAARDRSFAWTVPILATAGSLAGAALTFWMGAKIGENGLERYVPPRRLQRIRRRVGNSGTLALAALDLIPPPFPFTPFVLAAGALEVNASKFFVTLCLCRLLRFGLEAFLAVSYGTQVLAWLDSPTLQAIVAVFLLLACIASAWSAVRLIQATRHGSRRKRSIAVR